MSMSPHETLIQLFWRRPTLAPEILRDVFRVSLPAFETIALERDDLRAPAADTQLSDWVALHGDEGAVFSVLVEAPSSVEHDRAAIWLIRIAELQAKTNAPAALLILTKDATLASFCEGPFFDDHPALSLAPLVLGPGSTPLITDEAYAKSSPEIACLSAWVHSEGPHAYAAGKIAMRAIAHLDDERFHLYADLVLRDNAAREALLLDLPQRSGP